MIRSRIELVNALSTMETDRLKYEKALGEANNRAAGLEAALRETDEVCAHYYCCDGRGDSKKRRKRTSYMQLVLMVCLRGW